MAKRSKQRGTTRKQGLRIPFKPSFGSFMVLFIIVLMVGSTVAFIVLFYGAGGSGQNYDGVTFKVDQNINGYSFKFDGSTNYAWDLPPDVADVNVPSGFVSALDNTSRVTIARSSVQDQYLAVATYYLSESLIKTGRFSVSQALTDGASAVNCSDASAQNPMILFRSADTSNLTYSGYCLTVDYGTQQDILRYRDAILFHALGILG